VFRATWKTGAQPVQWNLVRNRPGTLRGVHSHWRHEDYLVPFAGPMWLALKDIRPDSPTRGVGCELDLHGDQLVAVRIPPGVAHGFYFASDSMFLFGVSAYWDTADELACAWNDPELGFGWDPMADSSPILSRGDSQAGSLAEMTAEWIRRRRTITAHG
jgi:dTDP-4-dehydrorhamnose 3,5-epimerase